MRDLDNGSVSGYLWKLKPERDPNKAVGKGGKCIGEDETFGFSFASLFLKKFYLKKT